MLEIKCIQIRVLVDFRNKKIFPCGKLVFRKRDLSYSAVIGSSWTRLGCVGVTVCVGVWGCACLRHVRVSDVCGVYCHFVLHDICDLTTF